MLFRSLPHRHYIEGRKKWVFTPFGCMPTQAYHALLARGHLHPIQARPLPNPLPRSVDLTKKCKYNSGASGHSTDDCFHLRHKIQDLIEVGHIKLGTPQDQPNVQKNPLPNHTVNAIALEKPFCDPSLLIGPPEKVIRIPALFYDHHDICAIN